MGGERQQVRLDGHRLCGKVRKNAYAMYVSNFYRRLAALVPCSTGGARRVTERLTQLDRSSTPTQSDAVGPDDVLCDQRTAVSPIQTGLLDLGGRAPVTPVQEAGHSNTTRHFSSRQDIAE